MKFGVREICEVVLRAKADNTKIGNQTFQKDEPVIYFDSLKTSTTEGAATTVYATGGRGNSRLLAWEGERTVTFTMEDALISPMGFAILSGAGLFEATAENVINVHATVRGEVEAMATEGVVGVNITEALGRDASGELAGTLSDHANAKVYAFQLKDGIISDKIAVTNAAIEVVGTGVNSKAFLTATGLVAGQTVMVDFYVEKPAGAQQLEITPDKFAGYYYLEASTLFRRQDSGKDMPAVFVIPKAKIQSAFSFAMASSGDPSTFTFTMDAFPDYTKFDQTKQVLFALQIVGE